LSISSFGITSCAKRSGRREELIDRGGLPSPSLSNKSTIECHYVIVIT
jgi:hypothetical protein